jgi:hypothetical protein
VLVVELRATIGLRRAYDLSLISRVITRWRHPLPFAEPLAFRAIRPYGGSGAEDAGSGVGSHYSLHHDDIQPLGLLEPLAVVVLNRLQLVSLGPFLLETHSPLVKSVSHLHIGTSFPSFRA